MSAMQTHAAKPMKLGAWLNQARRPFGVQEPSHKHTRTQSEALRANRCRRRGQSDGESGGETDRQRVRSVEHAVD